MTGAAQKVLLISSETLSKITDYTDRSTCVLFGDGAAAAVITLGDGIYASYLAMDAHDAHVLYARTHDNLNPFSTKGAEHPDGFTGARDHFLYMDGRAVYKFAVKAMPEAVQRAVERAGLSLEDIDYIVPHQANIRIVQTAAKTLRIPGWVNRICSTGLASGSAVSMGQSTISSSAAKYSLISLTWRPRCG